MTAGVVSYYHNDHLGSVNVLSDTSGVSRSLTEYDPFGKVSRFERYGTKIQTGWESFNGKKLDDETGLLFYGGRYYDPKLGRFITADDEVQDPENPQTLNRYAYCSNNPVNYIDPDGHSWFSKFFKKFGDFFFPLGRAIVTGDWADFGRMALAAVGLLSGNPFLMAASAAQMASIAFSHVGGNIANEISKVLNYAALALAIIGGIQTVGDALSTPNAPPSAELGYDNATGAYLGAGEVELRPIIVGPQQIAKAAVTVATKPNILMAAVRSVSDFVASNMGYIQTALAVAGAIPGIGMGFDVVSATISAATGDFGDAALSLASGVPFFGWAATMGRVGPRFWSTGRAGSGVKNAFAHWKKHATEFPELNNAKEYVEAAHEFRNGAGNVLRVKWNGDVELYNARTNTYASYLGDGTPKTYFRPKNGAAYFNKP